MFCDSALIVLQNALAACNLLASHRRIEHLWKDFAPASWFDFDMRWFYNLLIIVEAFGSVVSGV